ncbi:dephospho-CoA kinase [Deinococcus pimensis]|uniref:dephospho-CoA kinase n=1 Tax=Deinococcus pimensis TaxID=309888 RepID=UPI000487D278|nr:dephospho-CoA kinase [Deinococcus pimensis]
MTPAPRRLGLTGSIGAGKSTVARLLRERGLDVIDADAIARTVSSWPEVLRDVRERLGEAYVTDGALDRPALAALVFRDPEARTVLNGIVHPRVRAEAARQEANARSVWVVHDVPLLFENGLERGMDATLLVDAPLSVRVARVVARDGLSPEQVAARDAAQMPPEEKRRRASVVLDNGGDLTSLEAQLDAALVTLGVTS